MAADAKTASDEKPSAEATLTGGRSAKELREVADGLRNRVDLFGKALAAIATLGTTAVGLNKIGDLFPTAGHDRWAWAACIGLGIAALAAIWVAVRLMMVAGPAFISADPSGDDDVSAKERKDEVEPIFRAAASRFGYTSLAGLLERERSMRGLLRKQWTRRSGLAGQRVRTRSKPRSSKHSHAARSPSYGGARRMRLAIG